MNNTALKTIYNLLMQGETFGKFKYWDYYNNKPFNFPYFETVLQKHYCKNLFLWTNFGSSANKATLENLSWIIKTIFNTSPEKFLIEYQRKTDFERMKTAINLCIENGEKIL